MELPKYQDRVSLNQLAKEEHVDLSTAWRWAHSGIGGHVLETFVVGRKRFTTREAIARWCAALNGLKSERSATAKQQERAAERFESELDAKLAS